MTTLYDMIQINENNYEDYNRTYEAGLAFIFPRSEESKAENREVFYYGLEKLNLIQFSNDKAIVRELWIALKQYDEEHEEE